MVLIILALIPTLLYVYTIYKLGNPEGNLDMGSVIGSYFGLLFLVAAYASIGIYTSSLTNNQIVAFILAVFISFFFYFGFEGLSNFNWFGDAFYIEKLGMESHFKSMSRGVLDTRDIIYFLSVTAFFIIATKVNIKRSNR